MQGRGRTQREDYFEDLQKMERQLRDEDPGPKPALTPLEQAAADLHTTKYNIAYAKLTERLLAKEKPNMKDEEIKAQENEIWRMRESHADVERSFNAKEAGREAILRRLEVARKSKSTDPTTTAIEMEKVRQELMTLPELAGYLPLPLIPLSYDTWSQMPHVGAAQEESEMSPEDVQLYESMKCFRKWTRTRTPSNRSKPRLSNSLRDTKRWVMEPYAVEDFYEGLLNRLAS